MPIREEVLPYTAMVRTTMLYRNSHLLSCNEKHFFFLKGPLLNNLNSLYDGLCIQGSTMLFHAGIVPMSQGVSNNASIR